MSILCRCGSCNTKFRVKEKLAGQKARCAKCGEIFRIPRLPTSTPQPVLSSEVSEPEEEIVLAEAIEELPMSTARPSPDAATPPLAQPLSASALPVAKPLGVAVPQATPMQSGVPMATPLDPGSRPGGITIETQPRRRRRKKTGLSTALVTMLFLASCLILIAALFVFLLGKGAKSAILRVEIPTNIREDCAVIVDGDSKEVNLTLPLEYEISAGKHRVSLRRLDHERVNYDLDVKGAEIVELAPKWILKRESPSPPELDEAADDAPMSNELLDEAI